MIESTLKVAKDPLGCNKVNFPGIMHVQADLLDSIGDVRPGECEILESTSKTAISSRVFNRWTSISRHFGTSVDRGGARFAVAHAMASKYVQCVLSLGEIHAVFLSLNSHTKKMMDGPKIFHSKFFLQCIYNLLKERLRGGSQDNIVHIEE
jgi:hypothetical protein